MIRKFINSDIDEIMKIWLETNINAHDFIEENYWRNNYDMVKETLPKSDVIVYEKGGVVKGFVGLMGNYIAGIFVEQSYQSSGVGKELIDYVKTLKSNLVLSVYKKNTRAVNFYLREGFFISDEKIDDNTNQIEFVMEWK